MAHGLLTADVAAAVEAVDQSKAEPEHPQEDRADRDAKDGRGVPRPPHAAKGHQATPAPAHTEADHALKREDLKGTVVGPAAIGHIEIKVDVGIQAAIATEKHQQHRHAKEQRGEKRHSREPLRAAGEQEIEHGKKPSGPRIRDHHLVQP